MRRIVAMLLIVCLLLACVPAGAESMKRVEGEYGLSVEVPSSWSTKELDLLDLDIGTIGTVIISDENGHVFMLKSITADGYGAAEWEEAKRAIGCTDAMLFNDYGLSSYVDDAAALEYCQVYATGELDGHEVVATRIQYSDGNTYFITCQIDGADYACIYFTVKETRMKQEEADAFVDRMLSSMRLNGKAFRLHEPDERLELPLYHGATLSLEPQDSSMMWWTPFYPKKHTVMHGEQLGHYESVYYAWSDEFVAGICARLEDEYGVTGRAEQMHVTLVNDFHGFVNLESIRKIGTLGGYDVIMSMNAYSDSWVYIVTVADDNSVAAICYVGYKDMMDQEEAEAHALEMAQAMKLEENGRSYSFKPAAGVVVTQLPAFVWPLLGAVCGGLILLGLTWVTLFFKRRMAADAQARQE